MSVIDCDTVYYCDMCGDEMQMVGNRVVGHVGLYERKCHVCVDKYKRYSVDAVAERGLDKYIPSGVRSEERKKTMTARRNMRVVYV